MMAIDFTHRVQVPEDVLVSELEGESVLLNLQTESYFGLDEVGAWMWNAVTRADSVEAGFQALTAGRLVEPDRLREDLTHLLEQLVAEGLLRLESQPLATL